MNLLLIDSRIPDKEGIISSLLTNVRAVVFSYETDSYTSLLEKIAGGEGCETFSETNTLPTPCVYENIGIAQLNYKTPTFDFLLNSGSENTPKNIVENVAEKDEFLNSWKEYIDFLKTLVSTYSAKHIDLLACDIWANSDWVYVINKIKEMTNAEVYIRASVNITGFGGDFILESDNVNTIGIYFTDAILAYKYSFDFHPYYQTWSSGNEQLITSTGVGGTYNFSAYSAFMGTYSGNVYAGNDVSTNITGIKNHHVIGSGTLQTVIYHKLDGTIITGGAYVYGGNASRDATLGAKLVNIKKIVPYGGGFFALKTDGTGILVWGTNSATPNVSYREITTYNLIDAIGNSSAILGITSANSTIFINTTTTTDLTSSTGTGVKSYVAGNTCFGVIKADDSAYLYDNAGTGTSITGLLISKIYANATGATSLILCSDNTIRNVSKTVLFTLNLNVYVRKFVPFYSNNYGICFTDNSGAFSISNVITTVQGMTDFVANTYSYAYIKDGSVVLGGTLTYVSGSYPVPTGYSITDGNAVKIWTTNNTSYAILKNDRSMVVWGSDITYVGTFTPWTFTSVGGELTSCVNVQNTAGTNFSLTQNNVIYSLGTFSTATKTLQSISKTVNKMVDIQCFTLPSLVEYDASAVLTPSTVYFGIPTNISYYTNDPNLTTEPYRVYALCCGTNIVSRFTTPETPTNTYLFSNVLLTGEFVDKLTIYDITATNSLALAIKLCEITPTIIQPPSEPIITKITYASQTATIYFTVASNGGDTIFKYQYSINDGDYVDAVGLSSPITISGLTDGQLTRIKLVAVNMYGTSVARQAVVNGAFDFYNLSLSSPDVATNAYIPNWTYTATGTTTNFVEVNGGTYNGISIPVGYTKQCVLVNNQTGAGNGTLTLTQQVVNENFGMKKLQFQMAHVPFPDETGGYLQVQYDNNIIGNIQLANTQLGVSNAPTIPFTPYTMYFDTKKTPLITLNHENVVKNIDGLQLWLDAQDTNSLSLTGSSLNTWTDTSPNARSATKFGTYATNAQYSSTGLNGLPAIQFTNTAGTNNGLSVAVPSNTFLTGMTIFVVFSRNSNVGTTQETLLSRNITTIAKPFDMYGTTRTTGNGTTQSTYTSKFNVNSRNTTGIYSCVMSATTLNEYFNGYNTLSTTTTNYYDGGATTLYIATRADKLTGLNGSIGQIIIYSGALTNGQRQTIELYLANRWNMSNLLVDQRPYTKIPLTNVNITTGELKFIYYSARVGATPSGTSTLHLTGINITSDSNEWIVPYNSTQAPQITSIDASNSCAIVNLNTTAGYYPQKYQYSTDGVNYTDLTYTDTTFNGISMINGASISTDYPLKPNGKYSLKLTSTISATTTQYAILPSINKTTSGFSANFWMLSNSTMATPQTVSPITNPNFDLSMIELNTWRIYSAQLAQSPIVGWSIDASNSFAQIVCSNGLNAYTDSVALPTGLYQCIGLKTGGACYGISIKQTISITTAGCYTFLFYVKAKTGSYNITNGLSVSLINNTGVVIASSPIYTNIATSAFIQIQIPISITLVGNYVLSFNSTNPALVDSTIFITGCAMTFVSQTQITPVFTMNSGLTFSPSNPALQLFLYGGLLYSCINNGTTVSNKNICYSTLNDTKWYHISFNISSNGTQTTYINGQLQSVYYGQPILPAVNYSTNYLGMSLITDGLYNFNGFIDDLRIYGRDLTATEAMDLYNYSNQTIFPLNTDVQLISRWKFNNVPYTNKIIIPLLNGNTYNLRIRANDNAILTTIQNYNFGATQYAVNTATALTYAPTGWNILAGASYTSIDIRNNSVSTGYTSVWNSLILTNQYFFIAERFMVADITIYQDIWFDKVGTYNVSYYYGGGYTPVSNITLNVLLDGSGINNPYPYSNIWNYANFNVNITSTGYKRLLFRAICPNTAQVYVGFTNFKITSNFPTNESANTFVSSSNEPIAPYITTITPTNKSANIYFTQQAIAGSSVVSYKYRLNGGELLDCSAGITSPIKINGLTNGTTYTLQLYAVNNNGYLSIGSNILQTVPYSELFAIDYLSLDFSQNNAIIKYNTSAYPSPDSLTYRYLYSIDNGNTTAQINNDTYTMVGTNLSIYYTLTDKKVGNSAMNFQGGYLSIPAFNSSNSGISVACWFKMTSITQPTTYSKIFDFGNNTSGTNTGYNNISFFTKYNGVYTPAVSVYTNVGTLFFITWPTTIFNLDKWYHSVLVFNTNQTVELYINGVSIGSQYCPYPEPILRNINYIGASTSTGETYNFYGILDDFRVYNGKVLTSAEINSLILYDASNPNTYTLNMSLTPELLFYYTFNQQTIDLSFNIAGLTKNTLTPITPYIINDIQTNIPFYNQNFDINNFDTYKVISITNATDISGWIVDFSYTNTTCYISRGGYYNTSTFILNSPTQTLDYNISFQCITTGNTNYKYKFYTNTYLPIGLITVSIYANLSRHTTTYLLVDNCALYSHYSAVLNSWVLRTFTFYNYSSGLHKLTFYTTDTYSGAGEISSFCKLSILANSMQFRIPQKVMHYGFNSADISGSSFLKNQASELYDASLNSGAFLTTSIKKYDTACLSLTGLNQYVQLPNFILPTPVKGSGITISFWYYGVSNPTSGNTNIVLLRPSSPTPNNTVGVQYNGNGQLMLYVYNDGALTMQTLNYGFFLNTWMYLTFTIQYNTSTTNAIYSIYSNASLLGSSTATMNYPKIINRDNNVITNPGNIQFTIDEFKIFTDCLSQDEIRELYNLQIPLFENPTYKSYISTRQITTIGAPNAPSLLSLVPTSSNTLTAYFTDPANNGGSSITGYKYSIGINSTQLYTAVGNSSPITLSVPSNQQLDIFIYAVNAYGVSTKSNMITTMAYGFDNTPLNYIAPTATSVDISFQELSLTGYQPTQYKYSFNGITTDLSSQNIEDITYGGKYVPINRAGLYNGFITGVNGNASMTTSGAGTNATTVVLTTSSYIRTGWYLYIVGSTSTPALITGVSFVSTTATLTLATQMTWATGQLAVAYPNGDNKMYLDISNGKIASNNILNGNIKVGYKYRTTSGIYTVSDMSATTGLSLVSFAETITNLIPSVDMLSGIFFPEPILFNSCLNLYAEGAVNVNPQIMFENTKFDQNGLSFAFWMWGNTPSNATSARIFIINEQITLIMNGSNGILTLGGGFVGGSQTSISTNISVNTQTWKYVVITINPNKIATIYIDNSQNVSSTISNYPSYNTETNPVCVIGSGNTRSAQPNPYDSFTGYISDFRIYNGKVLSTAEISALYAYKGETNFALDTDPTLTTRFKFDISTNELIPPRRDYTLLNGVKYDTVNTVYGVSSFKFDASGSSLVSPQIHTNTVYSHRRSYKRGFSITFWVKPNIATNTGYSLATLISSCGTFNPSLTTYGAIEIVLKNYNTIRVRFGNGGNTGNENLFSVNINNNQWNHIAVILSSNGYTHLYLNGNLAGCLFSSSENSEYGWPIIIGSSSFGIANGGFVNSTANLNSSPFNGNMDDIRIYNGYILTQTEVQTIYNYRGEDPTHYLNTHRSLYIWCKADKTMTSEQLQLIDSAYVPASGAYISTIDYVVGTASMRIPSVGFVKMPALTISSTVGISISFWLRCQSTTSNNYILDYRSLPANANEFAIVSNVSGNGSIGMYMNGTLYSAFSTQNIITNQWFHITFTITTAGTTTLYINGVAGTPITTGYPTIKGKTVNYLSSSFSSTFDGCIDDLRIYNGKVLSSTEVISIYGYRGEAGFVLNSDPTLLYYQFEPYEDKNIQYTQSLVKTTITNPIKINRVQYNADSVVNKYSVYFPYGVDGKASYVLFPGIALHPHGFTVSTWIKCPAQASNTSLFQISNSSFVSYIIYLNNSDNKLRITNTFITNGNTLSTNTVLTNVNVCINKWLYLTVVVNGMNQTTNIYINSVLTYSMKNSTYYCHTPAFYNTVILGNSTTVDGFTGYVDDFRFYNGKIFTQTEVSNMYTYRGELGFVLDNDPTLIIQYPKETYSSAKSARTQVSGLITGTTYPYTLTSTLPIKNLLQNGNFDIDGVQTSVISLPSYNPPTYWLMTNNLISSTASTPRLFGSTILATYSIPAFPFTYTQGVYLIFSTTILASITSSTGMYQNIYLTPDTYTFTYYVAVRPSVSINITLYSAIGSVLSSPQFTLLYSTWNKCSYTFTVSTAGVYPVRIGFTALNTLSQTEIIITGASLSKTTTATRSLDVIPYTNPDPPVITTVVEGNQQLSVNLTQEFTGGLPISKYMYSINNGTTWIDTSASSSPVLITGLTNGQTYSVMLRANNSRLDSSNSNTITGLIPYTNPDVPTIITADPSNASIIVAFTLGNNGGRPITQNSYSINGGASYVDISSITSPFTITGLTNGQTYSVLMKTNNGMLDSSNSNTITEIIPYTKPSAPVITSIIEQSQQLTVEFTQELSGGYPLTKYAYSINNGSTFTDVNTTTSPIVITGLANGTTYPVVLKAFNTKLESSNSIAVSATPYTTPDPPTITAITPDNEQLTVYFTEAYNGGAPITKYKVSIDGGQTFTDASGLVSPITVRGLTNQTNYSVVLREYTKVDSSNSNIVDQLVFERPTPPTITGIIPSNSTLSIYFTPSTSAGTYPISKYRYSTDNGITFIDVSASQVSPIDVSGLINGVEYKVVMRSSSLADSNNSNIFTATPYNHPEPPTITHIDGSNGKIFIYFTLGELYGKPLTNMIYSINNGLTYASGSSLTSPILITGLINGMSYRVKICAGTVNGYSGGSNMVYGIPYTTPSPPSFGVIRNQSGESLVSIIPGSANGSPITHYQYTEDYISVYDTSVNNLSQLCVGGLENGRTYYMYFRAVNIAGGSKWIGPITLKPVDLRPPSTPIITDVSMVNGIAYISYINTDDTFINEYKVNVNNVAFVSLGPANPLPIVGLRLGVYYTFSVQAVNGNGESAPSPFTAPISIAIAPSYLFIRSIVPNYNIDETLVYITYPDDGGSPITKYQYSYNGGQYYDLSGLETPFSIYGLPQNELLSIRIKAITAIGETVSPPKQTTVVVSVPPKINYVYTAVQNKQMTITFKPISNNGSVITAYNYLLYRDGVADSSYVSVPPVQPIVISNLINNVAYSVQLYATNGIGDGEPSNATVGKMYMAVSPSIPVIYTITSIPTQATIYLMDGQSIGSPILYYSYSINGGQFVDTADATTPIVISGLQNNMVYSICLTATNETGTSGISRTYLFRVNYNTPTRPYLLKSHVSTADGFIVRFLRPNNNNGSVITGYKYRLNSGEWNVVQNIVGNTITISGLSAGQYLMELRAVNSVGDGDISFARIFNTL